MDKETITVKFKNLREQKSIDLEIPVSISANELVVALNDAYELGIDVFNIKKCYLQAENPIVLLRGNKTLEEFGLRNGSEIYFTD